MIQAHLGAEVRAYGRMFPVYVFTIEHPDGLVLVDTGMIDSRPDLDETFAPVPHLLPDELVARVAVVINTHLHFDHCGGNRLFAGTPIHVQARELADGKSSDTYVNEWVDFAGATYVEHDGEAEVLPGIRLLPTPGHTAGHQSVPRRDGRGAGRHRRRRRVHVPRARDGRDRRPAACARPGRDDVALPRRASEGAAAELAT